MPPYTRKFRTRIREGAFCGWPRVKRAGWRDANKSPENLVPYEPIKRRCLACGREFIADGRFLRMCLAHRYGQIAGNEMRWS